LIKKSPFLNNIIYSPLSNPPPFKAGQGRERKIGCNIKKKTGLIARSTL